MSVRPHSIQLNHQNWRRVIGIWQVIGGAAGFLSLAIEYHQQRSVNGPMHYVVAPLFFGSNVVAGALLLRLRPAGEFLSLVVQALQTIRLLMPGLYYHLQAGPSVSVTLSGTGVALSAGATAAFAVVPVGGDAAVSVGINLVATGAALYLICTDVQPTPNIERPAESRAPAV